MWQLSRRHPQLLRLHFDAEKQVVSWSPCRMLTSQLFLHSDWHQEWQKKDLLFSYFATFKSAWFVSTTWCFTEERGISQPNCVQPECSSLRRDTQETVVAEEDDKSTRRKSQISPEWAERRKFSPTDGCPRHVLPIEHRNNESSHGKPLCQGQGQLHKNAIGNNGITACQDANIWKHLDLQLVSFVWKISRCVSTALLWRRNSISYDISDYEKLLT